MQRNIIFNKKLTTKDKVAYGLGDMASQFIYGALSMYILIFWTDVVGIAAVTAGNILLLSKIWDGINDPLMGAFIDKHEFNGEKARPYLKWFAIPFGIAAVICFISPDVSMAGKVIYAFLAYNITNMIYTIINIPYGILATKMTNDVEERGSLNIFRMFFAMSGVVIIGLVTPFLVNHFGFFPAFAFLGILSVIIWMYVYSNTSELPKDEVVSTIEVKHSTKSGIKSLLKNRVWIILALGMLFTNIASSLMGGTAAYYIKYFMDMPALVGIFIMIPTLGQIVTLGFIADPMFKKYGKIRTTQFSLLLATLFSAGIYFVVHGPEQVLIFAILLFLQGMAIGPVMSATFAMLADSIEYGEYKTGERIEGLTYAGASLGIKIGAGLGTAMVGYILAFVGYEANATQTVDAINGIRMIYVLLPVIFYIGYAVILQFNPLDKIYRDIERELVKRRGAVD